MLLVRPDHVGDVLLTAPAVALLRTSLPDAELTYLVGPWSREVAERGPNVDRVCTLAFPGFTRTSAPTPLAPYWTLLREAAALRRARYDVVVVFRPDHWWGALLCAVAGIPVRVGAATPETTTLLTHRLRPADAHWAAQAHALAALTLNVCRAEVRSPTEVVAFRISEAARAAASAHWTDWALEGRRVVAIQPSAGAVLKSWPIERWAGVADRLVEDGDAVVLTGAPADAALLGGIAERMMRAPAAVLRGQSLDVTAAVFERCDLLIGLDGGAAHLAAAVGTPTVRLYGPASADRYGPWPTGAPDQHVLVTRTLACVPCGNLESPPCGARSLPACLLATDVDDVVELARAQLRRG